MTNTEKYMAYMLLAFPCTRYCMDTTRGGDKGEEHWKISRILACIANELKPDGQFTSRGCDDIVKGTVEIHDYLTHNITDNMDKVIGLPLSQGIGEYIDYSIYGERFLNWIYNHWHEIMTVGKK